MEELIAKYNVKFYTEVEDMVEWKDWKLIIGDREYQTPYASESEWKATMEERENRDSARQLQKKMEENFSGEVYDEVKQILGTVTLSDIASPEPSDAARAAVLEAMRRANEDQQKIIEKAKEIENE